jgi:hypothetical protein
MGVARLCALLAEWSRQRRVLGFAAWVRSHDHDSGI